jgi:hypothetical protein
LICVKSTGLWIISDGHGLAGFFVDKDYISHRTDDVLRVTKKRIPAAMKKVAKKPSTPKKK